MINNIGSIIKKDVLIPLKWTPAHLAKASHIKLKKLTKILNNKAPIDADTSIRLGITLRLPKSHFLMIQSDLDIKRTKAKHAKEYNQIKPYKVVRACHILYICYTINVIG